MARVVWADLAANDDDDDDSPEFVVHCTNVPVRTHCHVPMVTVPQERRLAKLILVEAKMTVPECPAAAKWPPIIMGPLWNENGTMMVPEWSHDGTIMGP